MPTTNPVVATGTGTIVTGQAYLRLIQWVDDADDVANGHSLVITIGGCTLTLKVCKHETAGSADIGSSIIWQAGVFNPGIPVDGISVGTLDSGAVHVWLG